MWNAPTKEQLSQIPDLYATEDIPFRDKIIHAHFFIGSCDWFIVEKVEDGELMFGFAVLNGDLCNAEWGYISLAELKAINIQGIEVDYDIYWTPCPAAEVRTICKAMGWHVQKHNRHITNMTA